MPNIEIHGISRKYSLTQLLDMHDSITGLLKGAEYFPDVVITEMNSVVLSLTANGEQLFLRLWATSLVEIDDIVKRLDPLDIDIEVAPLLTHFIERRSVRLQKVKGGPGFKIIRAALGYGVVLLVTPADAELDTDGCKYYEYNPSRRTPGWNSDEFNEVSWEKDAQYLFSGQADGLGFSDLPEQPFPSLEAALAFVREKRGS